MDLPEQQPLNMDTLSGRLLTLIALSGELPAAQVGRLPYADSYKQFTVKALKRAGMIRPYSRDDLRGLRLTASGKDLLAFSEAEKFDAFFSGCTATNAPKYSIAHRLRLHRMAEVLVTMLNANVAVLPWEKPDVFAPVPPHGLTCLDQPAYYSSREVKELGEQAVKVRGSRSTGVLLADGGIFIVYNTGAGQMKWEYKAEMRLKALLEMELCQTRLKAQYRCVKQSAIVFAADMSQLAPLMGVGGGKRHNYFALDGGIEHIYFLTNDHYGEVVLQLLCYPDERAVLDGILSQDLAPPRVNWLMENDAMSGQDPVLFAYTCDMPRIRRFNTALERTGRTGTLYCFDFQKDAMRQVCGPTVLIRHIDFEAYERSVFLSPENS